MSIQNLLSSLKFQQHVIEPYPYVRGDWDRFFDDMLEISKGHKFALYNFCIVNRFKLIEQDSKLEQRYLQRDKDGNPVLMNLKTGLPDPIDGVIVNTMIACINTRTFEIYVFERSLLNYGLNQFDLAVLIMHEIMHYALGHFAEYASMQKRLNKGDIDMILNHKIQNIIHDSLINSSLCKRFKFDPKMTNVWETLYPDPKMFPYNLLRTGAILDDFEDQEIYDSLYSSNSASFYEIRAMIERFCEENGLTQEMPLGGGHGKDQGDPQEGDQKGDSEGEGKGSCKSSSGGTENTTDGSGGGKDNSTSSDDSNEKGKSGSKDDSDESDDSNNDQSANGGQSGDKSDQNDSDDGDTDDADGDTDGDDADDADDDTDDTDNSDGDSDGNSDGESDSDYDPHAEDRLKQSASQVIQEIIEGVEGYDDDASDQIKNPGDSHRKNPDHYQNIDVEGEIAEQGEPVDQGETMSSNRLGGAGAHTGIFLHTLKDFIHNIESSDFYENLIWYASPVSLGQSMNMDFIQMKKNWVGRGVIPNSHDRRWAAYKLLGVKKPFHVKPIPEDNFKVYAYIDVSPSTRDWHRSFISAIKFNFEYFEQVFGFSTIVSEITEDDLHRGTYKTGGGTSDCWAQHMLKNNITRAVIFTDGEFGGSWKKQFPEETELLVVYTDPGWSSYYFLDIEGVRQGYCIDSHGRFKKIDHTEKHGSDYSHWG